MNAPRILIVGSANIDLVTRVPHAPRPGQTVQGRSLEVICGGKGANQAVAAARLGARTLFAGCVGDDPFGERLRASLDAEGIDLSCLETCPQVPTGTATILVADDGQNVIVIAPGANAAVNPARVARLEPLFLAGLDAVLVQMEVPDDSVAAVLRLARRHGVFSILDVGVARPVPEEIIREACLISPNESEAEAITGHPIASLDDARHVAAVLRDMGAREVVLKLGRNGSLYASDETVHVGAFEIDAVDTTAAGDAFTAALAVAWRGGPPAQALRFANAAGALAAGKAGAQPSMPSRETVDSFMRTAAPVV